MSSLYLSLHCAFTFKLFGALFGQKYRWAAGNLASQLSVPESDADLKSIPTVKTRSKAAGLKESVPADSKQQPATVKQTPQPLSDNLKFEEKHPPAGTSARQTPVSTAKGVFKPNFHGSLALQPESGCCQLQYSDVEGNLASALTSSKGGTPGSAAEKVAKEPTNSSTKPGSGKTRKKTPKPAAENVQPPATASPAAPAASSENGRHPASVGARKSLSSIFEGVFRHRLQGSLTSLCPPQALSRVR